MDGVGEKNVFSYSPESLAIFREVGNSEANCTEFDRLLRAKWDEAMAKGVFRYGLEDMTTRAIPGKFGFVAQRNPKRFTHRRRPMDIQKLQQPFNPSLFNFNKISDSEVLFRIHRETSDLSDEHLIAVNISPIEYGHVLLVPAPKKCSPQVITVESLILCLELMALSGLSSFYMVANSLLAYASVNHLHYHFMYLNYDLPVAKLTGSHIGGGCYELDNHMALGFGFQLDTSPSSCASGVQKVIDILLANNLPHNVVMYRGVPFNAHSSACSSVIRILVIPRKPVYGIKELYEDGKDIQPFCAAACEIGLGFIPVIDQAKYPTITEDEVVAILSEMALNTEEFQTLKIQVKKCL